LDAPVLSFRKPADIVKDLSYLWINRFEAFTPLLLFDAKDGPAILDTVSKSAFEIEPDSELKFEELRALTLVPRNANPLSAEASE